MTIEDMTMASIEHRFEQLSKSVPIVDTHNDFPYSLRVQFHNEIHSNLGKDFDFDSYLTSHTDLKRMQEGRLGIQFFSCFIECKDPDYLYQDFNKANSAVRDTLEQIDVTKRLVEEYSRSLSFVRTADEAMKSFLEGGKISVTLGVEGLHQCDLSLAVVRQYYDLGVRYITITHNCDNPFATAASSVSAGRPDLGLTEFGKECIQEMNRLGVMVDLSHVSYKTMLDVLAFTKAPVIFSHSSVYTLTNHERNVRDDVLKLVKENGGVVCINFFPLFLRQRKNGRSPVTIEDAVDHIRYIIDLIGWDHVGFGSDFDGIPQGPVGLEDVSKYPELIKRVWLETGASEEQISKLMGLNVVRVWKEAEIVSSKMKKMLPVESNWCDRRWEFYEYAKEFPEIFPGAFQKVNNTWSSAQELDNND
jgi:membrane dipeptidase